MSEMLSKVLKTKKYVITEPIIKIALDYNLNINEFLVLIFLDNNYTDNFDADLIASSISLSNEDVMKAFNSLMVKKLVSLDTSRDLDGRINETVNLNGIYANIEEKTTKEIKKEDKENIFTIFERELGRTISSFELELINAWLMTGSSEELIIAALKEAIYNGATNFRYIDAIIHEWSKKGFKTEKDVNNYLESRREKKKTTNEELFDYNWLDDDE